MNYLKKVNSISTKRLTKDMINNFSILNCAAKKDIKYLSDTTRIELWKSDGMSEENIENINKSGSNFAPTFVDHHLVPDISFNGHCLIKNNISISK